MTEIASRTLSNSQPENGGDSESAVRIVPGEVGIWIFVFGDMLIFTLFFVVFLQARNLDVEMFSASQDLLNLNYGALNTILLLTSSWFVAIAIHAIRNGQSKVARRLLLLAISCGAGFSIVKFFEYGEKIDAGYVLTTNDFFMYYYVFTGVHFLHLTIGLGVLLFLYRKAKATEFSYTDIRNFESGGLYWHMVDLLWIVLFPLIYLVK